MKEQADDGSCGAWKMAARKEIAREDEEIDRLSEHPDHSALRGHDCFEAEPRYKAFATAGFGEDYWWEVSFHTCRTCRRKYLHVFLEDDGMPRSGRWYMGRVPMRTAPGDIQPRDARRLLSRMDRVFYGGSYWGHAGEWSDHPESVPDLREETGSESE